MLCFLTFIGVSKKIQKVKGLTDVATGAATLKPPNKKIKLGDKMSVVSTGTSELADHSAGFWIILMVIF